MTEAVRVYLAMRSDIISCELIPGAAVSEAEMTSRYKASRTPVREACRKLQEERLLQIISFKGYFIAPLTFDEFRDLNEMLLVLDPAAAAMAAERATEEQIISIERWANYVYHPGEKKSYETFLDWNYNLHVEIAAATGGTVHDAPDPLIRVTGRSADKVLDAPTGKLRRWNVYVVAVFAGLETGAFDVWEMTFRFDFNIVTEAIEASFSRAHEILDDPVNVLASGYQDKPLLYAVTNVDSAFDLANGKLSAYGDFILLRKIATLTESELERVKAFEEVPVPFRIMFVG